MHPLIIFPWSVSFYRRNDNTVGGWDLLRTGWIQIVYSRTNQTGSPMLGVCNEAVHAVATRPLILIRILPLGNYVSSGNTDIIWNVTTNNMEYRLSFLDSGARDDILQTIRQIQEAQRSAAS